MKRIIMFVLLFAALKVAGQTTGYLRFDTVKIMKQNGTCELYVINKSKDSLGILTNIGGGLTSFKKSKALNDSVIVVGNDTLTIKGIGSTLTNASGAGDTLLTSSNTIKRIDHDATLVFSTNGSKILEGVDTISYIATKSNLRDTAAALRLPYQPGNNSKFLQTNGTNPSWQYPLNWVDVTNYGAVDDSSTDCTTPIQNAINAVSAAGGGHLIFSCER